MMDLYECEAQTEEFMRRRCREHLEQVEKLQGRKIVFDYRYEHTRTTAAIAGKLAEVLEIDPPLARIAAWLHDVAKCWDPRLDRTENQKREADHGRAGAKEAAQFLTAIGFPQNLTLRVEKAIANHVGFIKDYILPEPLDALLWDADKLSKICPAGVIHYLGAQFTAGEVVDLHSFFSNIDGNLFTGIRNSLNTAVAREWADANLEAVTALQKQMLGDRILVALKKSHSTQT